MKSMGKFESVGKKNFSRMKLGIFWGVGGRKWRLVLIVGWAMGWLTDWLTYWLTEQFANRSNGISLSAGLASKKKYGIEKMFEV